VLDDFKNFPERPTCEENEQNYLELGHRSSSIRISYPQEYTSDNTTAKEAGVGRIEWEGEVSTLHRNQPETIATQSKLFTMANMRSYCLTATAALSLAACQLLAANSSAPRLVAERGTAIPASDITWRSDGHQIFTASGAVAIQWDVTSGRELHRFPHLDDVRSVAISHSNQQLLTASKDGDAAIWDFQTGGRIKSFFHGFKGESRDTSPVVIAGIFSPNDKLVLTVTVEQDRPNSAGGSYLWTWNAKSGSKIRKVRVGPEAAVAKFSRDARFLVIGQLDGPVTVWDTNAGKIVSALELPSEKLVHMADFVAIAPDDSRIALAYQASESRDGLYDLRSGRMLRPFNHVAYEEIGFSGDGETIFAFFSDSGPADSSDPLTRVLVEKHSASLASGANGYPLPPDMFDIPARSLPWRART
jgi:hypothetical protein